MSVKSARIDPQGGMAGDMFIAAMIDTMPQLGSLIDEVMAKLPLPEGTRLTIASHHDGCFGGSQLHLDIPTVQDHRHWRELRAMLAGLDLNEEVRSLAIRIFGELAAVEAGIHGRNVDDVVFHEVGAWDSIIDIVLSAALVQASGITRWDVGKIPIGAGLIPTRHGTIAVPAPATRLLLQGFDCIDDGIAGERVTPTGAAILKTIAGNDRVRGKLLATGAGFGRRQLAGTSNCVWLSIFEQTEAMADMQRIDQICFEIDDATPEELALGLERLRAIDGVVDVMEMAGWGKKGRHVHAVRLLCEPAATQEVARNCFLQTPTLGLRIAPMQRLVLPRQSRRSAADIDIKIATRPGGRQTAKAESDQLALAEDHFARVRLARAATEEF